MNQLPKRKPNRIENYDYSQPNVYLITICTRNRERLFGTVDARGDTPVTILSQYGETVVRGVEGISELYGNVSVDAYSVLPNHVHLLLRLDPTDADRPPSVSRIIKQFKEYVTKTCGENLWQKGFHDRVVRSERDYQDAWNYVTNNPAKWETDEYFVIR